MKQYNKLKKGTFMGNVLVVMFSQVLVKLLGLIYRIYLTNRKGFGDEGNALNAGYQIYALLLLLSSIGIPSAVAKLVSEKVTLGDYKGAKKIFKVSLFTVGCAGLIGSMILFFGSGFIANQLLHISATQYTLMAVSPSVFLVAISSVIRGYFNGRNTMKPTAHSQSLEQVLKTVFTIVFVEIAAAVTSTNTVAMAVAANLATTFSVISSFIYIYIYLKTRKKFMDDEIQSQTEYVEETKKSILKKVLRVAIPLSLTSIIISLNRTIDTITVPNALMKIMSEDVATRIYGIFIGKVDTLAGLPLSLNIAFSVALIPEIASLKASKKMNLIKDRISLSFVLTILIGFPCAFGLSVFAAPILNLIFPNARDGAEILSAYSFIVIFTMLVQTLNATLQGLGNMRTPVYSLIIGLIIKTILNIILVPNPTFGIYGAIIASIVCYAVVVLIDIAVLKRMVNLNIDFIKCFIKPLLASLIMSGVSYLIYKGLLFIIPARLSTIIALCIAVLVYAISVVAFKILSKEEYLALPKGEKIYKLVSKFTRKFEI